MKKEKREEKGERRVRNDGFDEGGLSTSNPAFSIALSSLADGVIGVFDQITATKASRSTPRRQRAHEAGAF